MTTGSAVQVQPDKGVDPGKPVQGDVVHSKDGTQARFQATAPPAKPESKEGDKAGEKPAGDRPTWLPEKFQTPEDMAKAYAELERKQGSQKSEDKASEANANTNNATNEQATDVLKAAGLDRGKYDAEFAKDGKLTDASYAELASKGFTRELVDGWIAGQAAIAERTMSEVFKSAGGSAESYNQMTQWAVSNLTKAEIDAYNKSVDSADHNIVMNAVKGLHARYSAAEGIDPKLAGGRRPGNAGGDVFESTAQLTEAMRDPRYKTDQAYRTKVEQKLKRSNIL